MEECVIIVKKSPVKHDPTSSLIGVFDLALALSPHFLTVTGANGETDAFLLTVKDHIEALHDHSPHHCPSAGLGHSKLVAVLLG